MLEVREGLWQSFDDAGVNRVEHSLLGGTQVLGSCKGKLSVSRQSSVHQKYFEKISQMHAFLGTSEALRFKRDEFANFHLHNI